MPVFLSVLTEPDDRAERELARLADEQRCPSWQQAWNDWRSGDPALRLWAGWFNDRIVGAILTRRDRLDGLAVRRVTQNRGVGTRMLALLDEQGDWPVNPAMTAPIRDFIQRRRSPPDRA